MPTKVKGDKSRLLTEQDRNSALKVERLICVDATDNNNKFWNGYVLPNGDGYAEWGRVNKAFQHEYYAFGNVGEATSWLEDKSHEKQHKSGKASYTPQRTIAGSGGVAKAQSGGKVASSELKTIAAQQIQGDSETKKLVTWLADVNIHQITKNTQITYNVATGGFSTPLGLVTPDGISEARDILCDLKPLVAKRDWNSSTYKKRLTDYLRIIPQDLGMTRGWHETFLAASDAIDKQNDILDSLEASLLPAGGVQSAPQGQKTEQVFNVELKTVDDAKIIEGVKKKYRSEKGSHYDVRDYDVYKVWAVHISTVRAAFQNDGLKVGNIKQLWHGTRCSHLLSILKGGLIIPPANAAHVCGRLYGNGIYFSDQSTKSIRYATGAWSGSGNTDRTFMFICDVAMGKEYTPHGYQSGSFRIPAGYDSCFAKGGVSSVQNNEMIVYRCSQADLTYLVEFRKN